MTWGARCRAGDDTAGARGPRLADVTALGIIALASALGELGLSRRSSRG